MYSSKGICLALWAAGWSSDGASEERGVYICMYRHTCMAVRQGAEGRPAYICTCIVCKPGSGLLVMRNKLEYCRPVVANIFDHPRLPTRPARSYVVLY